MHPVNKTVAKKLFQYKTPSTCGAEIRGASIMVDKGLTNFLCFRPKKRISRKRIASWWKCSRSGWPAGLPNFQRLQIASPVSATGQKNIKSIANALTSCSLLISKIEDQTNKCPNTYAPPSPKNIFPNGKFNTIKPNTAAISNVKKIVNCESPNWKAITESDIEIDTPT